MKIRWRQGEGTKSNSSLATVAMETDVERGASEMKNKKIRWCTVGLVDGSQRGTHRKFLNACGAKV